MDANQSFADSSAVRNTANADANASANQSNNASYNANPSTPLRPPHTDTQAIQIQKLNGSNFLSWKRQIEIVLKLRGYISALTTSDDDHVDEIIEMQAMLILLGTMDEKHSTQVQVEPNCKAIMRSLERQYANTTAANKHRILSSFFRFTKLPSDTLNQHTAKLKDLKLALTNLGESVSEDVFQVTLIHSVAAEYPDFMSAWELVHPQQKTTEFLITQLQHREEAQKPSEAQAFIAKTQHKNTRLSKQQFQALPIEEKKRISTCKGCKVKGHWLGDAVCNFNKDGSSKSSKPERINAAFTLATGVKELRNEWVADTGATAHMCNNKGWFEELQITTNSTTCSMGDGSKVKVIEKGSVKIQTIIDSTEVTVQLNDVLYVPNLATNVVSVGLATDRGYVAEFVSNKCSFKKDNQTIMQGKRIDQELYLLEATTMTSSADMLLIQQQRTLEEWHKTLGHTSKDRIQTLARSNSDLNIGASTPKTNDCPDCAVGKGKHASHPTRKTPRATQAGERVHLDLSGKISTPTLEQHQYYLVCKDESTGFCFVYLLQTKQQVAEKIDKLITDFERTSDKRILSIHSDHGTEFENKVVKTLLDKERIAHTFSATHTPQQNSIVEREIGYITNMARTMLISSHAPTELWGYAMENACYIRNRLPTSASSITPYERLCGRKCLYSHIVPFGTEAYALINWRHLQKFDARAEKCIVVGYGTRRNTYIVYLNAQKRIVDTSDLIFNAHKQNESEEGVQTQFRSTVSSIVPINIPQQITQQSSDPQNYNDAESSDLREQGPANPRIIGRNGRPYIRQDDLNQFFNEAMNVNQPEPSCVCDNLNQAASTQDTMNTTPSAPPHSAFVDSGSETTHQELEHAFTPRNTIPRSPTQPNANAASRGPSLFILATLTLDKCEPQSYNQAVNGPAGDKWRRAIREELVAHQTNQTWTMIPSPDNVRPLSTRWIFRIKSENENSEAQYKARLVVRGFEQEQGVNFAETFAPVTRIEALRTLIAPAVHQNHKIIQFDVSTAFLNGKLEDTVYVSPPEGLDCDANKCLRLNKALYGLKQAPRIWNSTLDAALRAMGFTPLKTEAFVYKRHEVVLAVYVDDGIVIGPSLSDCKLSSELNNHFKTRLVDSGVFLRMEVTLSEGMAKLEQTNYTDTIIDKFIAAAATPVQSPLADLKSLSDFDESESIIDTKNYQSMIGSLLYAAMLTRPDILFTVNCLSSYNIYPRLRHHTAAKRVLKYLIGTRGTGISYRKEENLSIKAYADADFAGDRKTRRSTSGGLILVCGGPVVFLSRKQSCVAQSTCEAELIAANELNKELVWLTEFVSELGIKHEQPKLFVDNHSAIRLIKSTDTKRRSKHIETKYFFIREKFADNLFSQYLQTNSWLTF